ncbi:N-6 DNA methylase [Thalassolituus sp.]|uniref:type I restriction-modification system subunit M n=1 Tax=Thalassolituus sp. TaxID=2030822 RepID=UPI0035139FF0
MASKAAKDTKAKSNTKKQSFEQTLWATADKLRGSVESSEYKHVVLSLIFLKFISDKFAERKQQLEAEGNGAYTDIVEFYTMANTFYLPEDARWDFIAKNAKQDDIAVKIDTALHTVEKNNKALRGALPDNYFSRLGLDASKLAALIDAINNIDTIVSEEGSASETDIVGRVYEYFLGNFAATEGKGGGEFYTPKCVVNLLAEMIEPYHGKIYDPCCGSGGMFVQSVKFVENHQGNKKDISIYGQEQTSTTYKLAKMNLAIRGISANLGDVPADTFFKDQHPDLKADFIIANPPFNLKEWRGPDELTNDPRWAGYETPPTGNANYGWILHMISKLSDNGVAGFVLANGSMSTNTKGEGEIRKQIIENDLVDCMIALPGQLFYTTQIPVCLWFLTKNKKAQTFSDGRKQHRNREGETLFIDARNMGSMISRIHKELTADDIADIANTYHAWRGEPVTCHSGTPDRHEGGNPETNREDVASSCHSRAGGNPASAETSSGYEDIPGFCKSATLDDIQANDYVLTPGRYVGAAEIEDDGELFEEKMQQLTQTLFQQMAEAQELDAVIKQNLKGLGYGE